MNIIQLIVIVLTIIVNFTFALLILFQNRRSATNITFSLFLTGTGLWTFSNFIYNLPGINYDQVLFWMRSIFVITTPLLYILLIFSYNFPSKNSVLKRKFIILYSIPTIIITLLALTPLIVESAKIDFDSTEPVFGKGVIFYLMYALIYISISLIVLIRKYNKSKGIIRSQIQYLFLGLAFFSIPASVTNLLMVVILKNTILVPYGPSFSLLLALFVTISIIKHRFLSLTNIFNYILSIFLNTLILHILFYGLCFLYINIFGAIFTPPVYIIGIFLGVICSFLIQYLFNKFNNIRYINKKYDTEKYINLIRNKNYINNTTSQIFGDFCDLTKKFVGIRQIDLISNNDKESPYYKLFQYIKESNDYEKKVYLSQEDKQPFDLLEDRDELSAILCIYKDKDLIYILCLSDRLNFSAYYIEDIRALNEAIERLSLHILQNMLTDEQKRFSELLQYQLDKATEELRQQKNEIEDRYRTERDMVGIMGHELRTPLTSARGFLEIIMTKAKNNPDTPVNSYQHYLDNVYDAFKREIDLVQTMLSTSHVDNNKLNLNILEVDLEGVIKGAMVDFTPEAQKKNLILEYHHIENLPHIKMDPSRTIEVVNNLISNAIKYTDSGRVDILMSYDDQYVYYAVKDTGKGIPANEIPNIGKKFYRVENYLTDDKPGTNTIVRPGGTGLGMYIVKAILAAAGGELRIESKVGEGSTFTAVFQKWSNK